MEDQAMQDSFADIVRTLGGALVSPGPGSAELVIAVLVALGFVVSTVYSLFAKGNSSLEWWER
jgi:hypothetical protein